MSTDLEIEVDDGLTTEEQYDLLAKRGDVEGLWKILLDRPGSLVDRNQLFNYLLRAMQVGAKADPVAFADTMFAHLVSVAGHFAMRSQFAAIRLASHQFESGIRDPRRGIAGIEESLLRQVMETQRHVADLLVLQAQVLRLQ